MKKFLLIFVFLILVSCENEQKIPLENEGGTVSNVNGTSEIEFQRIQDSILKNYSGAIKLINQIDDELSKLSKIPTMGETSSYEQDILKKIDYLAFQLKSANDDINKLEIKLKSLGKENKILQEKIITMETILSEKDKVIESQAIRITGLESSLNQTISERDIAYEQKAEIEKFANETVIKKNAAYYIIGNEKNLVKDGIIKMEGEGFLGIGGKFIPSPETELKYFTRIDITKDTLLPFQSNVKVSDIVSTHNRKMIEIVKSSSGGDFLKIKNPDIFWRTDKMLIIIVEND